MSKFISNGEDILVWILRSSSGATSQVLASLANPTELFDFKRNFQSLLTKYDISSVLIAFDDREDNAEENVRKIISSLKSTSAPLSKVEFFSLRLNQLEKITSFKDNAIYVYPPESGEIPKSLLSVDKYWLDVADNLWPWPKDMSRERIQERNNRPPTWTEYFRLASQDRAKELEAIRTTLLHKGKHGTSQYVLLQGETGTGKSYIAKCMQGLLDEKYNAQNIPFDPEDIKRHTSTPFIQVNCASLPKDLAEALLFGAEPGTYTGQTGGKTGCLEGAKNGILFLDEIGDLPPPIQGKLLLALENKQFTKLGAHEPIPLECSIIFGTNVDLEEATRQYEQTGGDKGFRKDLLYRINSCSMYLPPIRERIKKDDTGALTTLSADFIDKEIAFRCSEFDIFLTHGASELLRTALTDGKYTWPGNFRDIRSLFQRLKTQAMTECGNTSTSMRNVITTHNMKLAIEKLIGNKRASERRKPTLIEQIKKDKDRNIQIDIERCFEICGRSKDLATAGRLYYGEQSKRNFTDSMSKHLLTLGLKFNKMAECHLEKAPQSKKEK